jgi:outer membrane protein assembly factor BamB
LSLRIVIAVLIVAALAGCSAEERPNEAEEPGRAFIPTVRDPEVGTPEALFRVVDGDTGRRVRSATVRGRSAAARADDSGLIRLEVPKRRTRVSVTAPGYIPRRLEVRIREDQTATIRLWRRSAQWPMYGATPARTQAHPGINIRPPFRVVWGRSMHSLLEFPAVVWEGVAYITNIRGLVRAVSMENGRILWRRDVGRVSAASPAVDPRRRVLVVTTKEPGGVTLVDMDNGKIRWRLRTARAETSPLVAGDLAYTGDESGRIFALDLARRKVRWVFSGADKITSSPALAAGRLFFGDYAGRVYALNARTGRRIWTGSAGTRVYGTVAVAHGRVFAPSVFSGLSALSARTGRLLWRVPLGAYGYSSPAFYRGRVYFGSYAGVVYCVSARTGRILWRGSTGGAVSGAVVVVGGVVYAGSFNQRITAWNWRTGRAIWTFPHGRYVPVSGNAGRLLLYGGAKMWAVAPKKKR